MRYREIEKILKRNEYHLVRSVGSHMQFKNYLGCTATVPNHGTKDISIGVLKSLERQTGLSFIR